jgi:hypothetical protein
MLVPPSNAVLQFTNVEAHGINPLGRTDGGLWGLKERMDGRLKERKGFNGMYVE